MRDRYASLREGLVGAWIPSVSGSGLLLPNLSGNGNNGALTNMGPEDWVAGEYGRALDFDGVDDQISTGLALVNVGEFSLTAWAKITSFATDSSIIGNWGTTQQILLYLDVDDAAVGYRVIFRNAANAAIATSANTGGAVLNKWQSVVATYNKQSLKIYTDGVRLDQTSSTQQVRDVSSDFFAIGADSVNNNTRNATGQLDDVRIYNRALSEPEIKLLASRPGIGFRPQRRTMYYAPPTGARRRRILTSMP